MVLSTSIFDRVSSLYIILEDHANESLLIIVLPRFSTCSRGCAVRHDAGSGRVAPVHGTLWLCAIHTLWERSAQSRAPTSKTHTCTWPPSTTIISLLSVSSSRLIKPIEIDFKFIEVVPPGTLFDIEMKCLVSDNSRLKGKDMLVYAFFAVASLKSQVLIRNNSGAF